MRLDKFFTHTGLLSRREAARAARAGEISVDGEVIRRVDIHIDPEKNAIAFRGVRVHYKEHLYLMLNKPKGYVSATEDMREHTVLELLPEHLQKKGLFPCGRLDKDTTGLMILTDDGDAAHRCLSPKHHAKKEYLFSCERTLERLSELERGVKLEDGYVTLPCKIEQTGERTGIITLTEGKYHQIKRMFEQVGNCIVSLERVRFAGIALDPALNYGQWRYLSKEEEQRFRSSK